MTKDMIFHEDGYYLSEDGWNLKRENGETPNGMPMNGRWVLRDDTGAMIDYGQYRNDIAEHNGLDLRGASYSIKRS